MEYWEETLDLSKQQFKSSIYLHQKPKQKYENHDSYHGGVALRIVKSINLKYRILALLKALGDTLD